MALSKNALRRLIIAMTSAPVGNELATALDNSIAEVAQSPWNIAAAIVATSVSTTTNFAALAVGDFLVHIPAAAGNAAFEVVAVAGTKPSAAVIGDLYVAIRVTTLPAAHNFRL